MRFLKFFKIFYSTQIFYFNCLSIMFDDLRFCLWTTGGGGDEGDGAGDKDFSLFSNKKTIKFK